MKTQSFNEIENLTKEYSMIPICKEIYADGVETDGFKDREKLKNL